MSANVDSALILGLQSPVNLTRTLDRIAVLKLRKAMVDNDGNVFRACKEIGLSHAAAYRLLQRDEKRTEAEMAVFHARKDQRCL